MKYLYLKHILIVVLLANVLLYGDRQMITKEIGQIMVVTWDIGTKLLEMLYLLLAEIRQILEKWQQQAQKSSQPVIYRPNFANLYGGATILMKSPTCHGIAHILSDDNDRYMYTETTTPIQFVIGLKEEIAVESISLKSREIYSSIVKRFKVFGSFTFPDAEWKELGSFKAANSFSQQNFLVTPAVVRYIKFHISSYYGQWSYFTLTQVKVFGQSMFAHAAQATDQPATQPSCSNDPQTILMGTNDESLKQQNLIVTLHQKLREVEQQNRQFEQIYSNLSKKHNILQSKLDRLLANNILENEQDDDLKRDITNINREVSKIGKLKDFLFQFGMIFVLLLVGGVLFVHLYFYFKDSDKEEKQKHTLRRKPSRAKTFKGQQKITQTQTKQL